MGTARRRKERPVTPLVDANGLHALLAKMKTPKLPKPLLQPTITLKENPRMAAHVAPPIQPSNVMPCTAAGGNKMPTVLTAPSPMMVLAIVMLVEKETVRRRWEQQLLQQPLLLSALY